MKKRLISLVLAAALILGIFSCSAFAAQEGTALDYFQLPQEGKMSLSVYSAEMDMEQDYTFYRKGDKIAMESEVPIDGTGLSLKLRMIIKDGNGYLLFPQIPFIYMSFDPDEALAGIDDMTVETELIDRQEETVEGKKRITEKYVDADGNILEYVVEDEKLYAAYSYDPDGNMISRVKCNEVSSCSVSDWTFYVPFFAIDIIAEDYYLDIE